MTSETPILFWKPDGVNGWMSNWSPHPFQKDGVVFPTMEHWLMWRKATAMGDLETASSILETPAPSAAKALGRRVAPFDEARWNRMRFEVAVEGLRLKLEQNEGLVARLLETGTELVGEASPYDTIWGIGWAIDHPLARTPSEWRGSNLLGKAWMTVRDELRHRPVDV